MSGRKVLCVSFSEKGVLGFYFLVYLCWGCFSAVSGNIRLRLGFNLWSVISVIISHR